MLNAPSVKLNATAANHSLQLSDSTVKYVARRQPAISKEEGAAPAEPLCRLWCDSDKDARRFFKYIFAIERHTHAFVNVLSKEFVRVVKIFEDCRLKIALIRFQRSIKSDGVMAGRPANQPAVDISS
jgi:hypothetical protein